VTKAGVIWSGQPVVTGQRRCLSPASTASRYLRWSGQHGLPLPAENNARRVGVPLRQLNLAVDLGRDQVQHLALGGAPNQLVPSLFRRAASSTSSARRTHCASSLFAVAIG